MAKKKLSDDLELEVDLEKCAGFGVLTMREIRQFIKDQKLSPTDLFNRFDVLEDPIMKEAVEEGVKFEIAYKNEESLRETKKMDKENKEIDIEIDLGIPGQQPSSEQPKKKPEEKEEPLESDKEDLLPPGEPSKDNKDDQEKNGELLPPS